MRKILQWLFSLQMTGLLLILFAVVIAVATFIENDFGTQAARARVYNARWFEFLLLLLAINLAGSIFRHRMVRREKWTVLLFHVAFLLILGGAAVSRFTGFEGMMRIREGESEAYIISDRTYLSISVSKNDSTITRERPVMFSSLTSPRFREKLQFGDHEVSVEPVRFVPSASERAVMDPDGIPLAVLVVSGGPEGRKDFILKEGDVKKYSGIAFSFGLPDGNEAVRITRNGSGLYLQASDTVEFSGMHTGMKNQFIPDSVYPFQVRYLYSLKDLDFVLKDYLPKGRIDYVASGDDYRNYLDVLVCRVRVDQEERDIFVAGGKGYLTHPVENEINGFQVSVGYGAKPIALPFSLHLNDFILERYPGSSSPSSFSSEVTVYDPVDDRSFPFRIFMNNVLNYKGYRFYQSSYDQDEKGTILSVNHDMPGTVVSYLGYFLMTMGMIAALFSRESRFSFLLKTSGRLRRLRRTGITALLPLFFVLAGLPGKVLASDTISVTEVDRNHARQFGRLLLQDRDGRVKPVGTLASEVLRKVSRKNSFNDLIPEQVMLGMMSDPVRWQQIPMIRISHPELKQMLGIEGKYASFNDLVNVNHPGGYAISSLVDEAYKRQPARRSKLDKDVIAVDERVNICYMVYTGDFMNLFPVPDDPENKWVNPGKAGEMFGDEEALFVGGMLSLYLEAVGNAKRNNDWTRAGEYLDYIRSFQEKYGQEIIPPAARQKFEVFYNSANVFGRLAGFYGLIGFVMLILSFIGLLRPAVNLRPVIRIAMFLVILLFTIHTAGLGFRWYISGHAPWSNGYESMIYIGWATVLAGLLFAGRSGITLSLVSLLGSLILSVAGMSWMDPEITNLVPVLKSYWLIIHVAVITASYGFLGLGALLGFFNLVLMLFRTHSNHQRMNLTIHELVLVIEMTLMVGLFMLTVGTFLGGVWANESWGRYWGWDPKETWALVTVLVYAFIMHMRYIPGFRGNFALSFAGLIAYSSVLMTYFGVNYYLSGLHSYAKGDPVPIPSFVYYTLAIIGITALWAFINHLKYGGGVSGRLPERDTIV
ncbi:MAG: cytochrome c biogenesis protein CcsA [Bacteroidales bacterium]|nr:cytochrome c biogenesis protein CcsA [Bacteroidales bacterium]